MSDQAPSGDTPAKEGKDPPPKPIPPHLHELPKGMDLVNHIAKCLGMGCDPLDVRKQLVAFGFAAAAAAKVMADTTEWLRKNPYVGKPVPRSPLYWALSHGVLLVGVISCIVGGIALAWPASDEGSQHYLIGAAAITAGVLAILYYAVFRVVR